MSIASSSIAGVDVTSTSATTLSNKTISFGSNTVTGTTAQFNTALTDNDFATIAGAENLTSKTLTAPIITSAGITLNGSTGTTILAASSTASGTLTLPAATDTIAVLAAAQTFTNKTVNGPAFNQTGTNSVGSLPDKIGLLLMGAI
jgi:hypothetical protein